VLRRLTDKGLLNQVAETGDYFEQAMQQLIGPGRPANSLRGRGLLRGLELKTDCPELPVIARKHGLMIGMVAGGRVVRLAPPLIISKDEIDALLTALSAALKEALDAASA
jgi:acetylornithine/succinyldiaminopimelate/putrescine aminotransferase